MIKDKDELIFIIKNVERPCRYLTGSGFALQQSNALVLHVYKKLQKKTRGEKSVFFLALLITDSLKTKSTVERDSGKNPKSVYTFVGKVITRRCRLCNLQQVFFYV